MLNQQINAKRAIDFFKIYIFFSNFLIFLPVLVVIYTNRNITTAEILLIESAYNITIAIFEIPTGMFGDKYGHDKSVIIGLIGTSVIFFLFAFSNTLISIILIQILLGFFSTCISGSDLGSVSVLIENVGLKKSNNIFSEIYVISTASMLLSYLLSGVIIKIDDSGKTVMIVEAIATLISCVSYIAYYLKKSKAVIGETEGEKTETSDNAIEKFKIYGCIEIIICGLLLGILSSGYLVSQVFMNNLNIDSKYLGVIYCVISILSILFAKTKGRLKKKTVILMPLLFLLPSINYIIIIVPFIVLYAYLKARVIPFVQEYISSKTKRHKARNLSISSMINNAINSIFMLGLSSVVYEIGFSYAMLAMTALTSILLMYLFFGHNFDGGNEGVK